MLLRLPADARRPAWLRLPVARAPLPACCLGPPRRACCLRVPGLPRKRVMAQLPLPGVRVKKGSKVNLHISH